MGNIYVRNGVWYARFQHKGKEYLRSTKVKVPAKGKAAIAESKAEAEAVLNRLMAEVKGAESVDALFSRLSEAIARLPASEQEPRRLAMADSLRQGVSARLAMADAWQAWLDSPRKRRPSETTIMNYQANWGRDSAKKHGQLSPTSFRAWLGERYPNLNFMHEVTDAIAEEYAGFLLKKRIAPRTYNGRIKFLRSMFGVLKKRAGLTGNPWDNILLIENETQGRRNLTETELAEVCASASGDMRYLLAIGLYTGLRLGDAVSLKWDGDRYVDKFSETHILGVNLKKGEIRVVPRKTRRKQKVLVIPLHPVLLAMLKQRHGDTNGEKGYVFPDLVALYEKGGPAEVTRHIQAHFKACGIETTEKMADGSRKRAIVRVGYHSLRHSFVSLCAANKVPQHAIQDLVGHGSPAMTALYAHADEKQRTEAIAALPAMAFKST